MRVSDMAGLDDLGVTQYWVMDAEGGVDPLVKAKCRPFMLAPGYRVEVPGPYGRPKERIPKQPGFVSGLGSLGYFEVVAPDGGQIAAFRCRPYYVSPDFAVKDVRHGKETLVQRGAAEFPEGTMRPRTSALRITRR